MANPFIHASAEVSENALIGKGTKIWHNAQIRENVFIGEDCVIGKDVYIDAGVHIGNRVKIQNGVSVYKGVRLEDEVFIGPNASFTNDLRPRSFNGNWQVVPTVLKRGASVGANGTILCGVTLGEYCMVSAGAVITGDALPYGLYIGNPARLKGFVGKLGEDLIPVRYSEGEWILSSENSKETLKIRFSLEQA